MPSLPISANSIKSLKTSYGIPRLLLLYLMQVSKTMLLCLQPMFAQSQILLQKLFIILSISHQLRQNCLQLDIVITDAIHLVKYIFDSSSHSYQLQSIVTAQDLRIFFEKNTYNSIKCQNYSSNTKWIHHSVVDKEIRKYNLKLIFLCKLSQDLSMKDEYDSIIQNQQITF